MDIDGDGKDDRETIKALITQNGRQVTMRCRCGAAIAMPSNDNPVEMNHRPIVCVAIFLISGKKPI